MWLMHSVLFRQYLISGGRYCSIWLLSISAASLPGASCPQTSCLRDLDISCIEELASLWCACFSSTWKFGSSHLSILSRKSRNEGWCKRSGQVRSFGMSRIAWRSSSVRTTSPYEVSIKLLKDWVESGGKRVTTLPSKLLSVRRSSSASSAV